MKGDLVRTGWYCPDCHRVMRQPVTSSKARGRWHNLTCGSEMIRVRVVRA